MALACVAVDQVSIFFQIVNVQFMDVSNLLIIIIGGGLTTQLNSFELVVTLCLVI